MANESSLNVTNSLIMNSDENYSSIPYAARNEDGQVYMSLNDLGIANDDGEEMVLIAADENMDMETLENLIASGAVTAMRDDGGAEYFQIGDQSLVDGNKYITLSSDQMHFFDPATKTYYGAADMMTDGTGGFVTLPDGQPDGINYSCPSCPAVYSNANAFTKHMREKHFVKVYACRQCEEFFETLSQLFLHARRTHVDVKKPRRNAENYKFHCDQCNYMTNNGGTMEHHKRAHTGEKPYICDVCHKQFAQKANMKTHRNRHLYRDKIFRCDTCNKAFSSYDIYLAHLRTREHELREHFTMMASSQLALECLGCSLTFDSIYNLNKHTRSCRIVRTLQTRFRCLPCDAYVSDVASLKAHVKAHEGSQIISCPVCGEHGFPGFNQLNHHITRAHALKVNRRHVCRYCESTFEIKKELDAHIRSMHSDERNARQSRGAVGRLKCRNAPCEFTTNSIMLLDRHYGQHLRAEEEESMSLLPPHSTNSQRHFREVEEESVRSCAVDNFKDGFVNCKSEENFPVKNGISVESCKSYDTQQSLTVIKSTCKPTVGSFRSISSDRLRTLTVASNGDAKSQAGPSSITVLTGNSSFGHRFSQIRRLPSWYNNCDVSSTSLQEKRISGHHNSQHYLPSEIIDHDNDDENDDLNPPNSFTPKGEWDVVYDDEDEESRSDSGSQRILEPEFKQEHIV